MDKNGREKLTAIIEAENGSNWWQPKEFEEKIRAQLPTQLEIISAPPSEAANYNCFVYTLGLEYEQPFLGGQNPIQQEFIKYLLRQGVLTKTNEPVAEDLVFYEDAQGLITHGGIVQPDGSILSKWMWGALFSHKLWDVPSSFGDTVFYCKPIDPERAVKEYKKYQDTGVIIKPIS